MRPRLRIALLWLTAAALAAAALACEGSDWAGNRNPVTFDRSPIAGPKPTPTTPAVVDGGATIVARDAGGSGAYEFDPPVLIVRPREPLVFTLRSETEAHTFTIDPLEIEEQVPAGGSAELEITFPQSGAFTFECSIHPRMTGVIHVK